MGRDFLEPSWVRRILIADRTQPALLLCLACAFCLAGATVPRTTPSQGLPCSEDRDEPPPFLKTVLLSKVILYGRILKTYPDPRYHDVYTAEMEVFCIIKGGRARRIVNITEAGSVPGNCFTTQLQPGSIYVLLVQFDGTIYRPIDTEKPGKETILDQVVRTCDVDPKYPTGVNERTAEYKCPVAPPGECIDLGYLTTTTTTTTEPTTLEDYEYYLTESAVPVDLDPFEQDLPLQSSSKSPVLITSMFSTSSTDYRLILSVRLLPVLVLSLLYKLLGACLSY